MKYPYRNDAEQAILDHMGASPYAVDDKPYFSTEQYAISGGYDEHQVRDKHALDNNGAEANYWWHLENAKQDRAINLGQR